MKINKRTIGAQGEEMACHYLEQANYKILERNFRSKSGEIDIIALDLEKDYIVFIEVKYRKNKAYGYPRESVNYYKQRNITKVASYYLLRKNAFHKNCRFDVVEILGENIELIQNAFSPVD